MWGLDQFDIYTVNRDGSDLRRLTNYDVYTAEGVLSPDGRRIVFTSLKDGDLDIYTMNVDGTDVRRLTTTPGYDGGPWWSPDGKKIVYRAWHPPDSAGLADYQGPARSAHDPAEPDGTVRDERRRQRPASRSPTSAVRTSGRRGLPTAAESSSRPTTGIREAATSICSSSTSMVRDSSRSRTTKSLTASRCSAPTVVGSSGRPIATVEARRDEPLHRRVEELIGTVSRLLRAGVPLPRSAA